ncbi:GDP-L-fucose synthase [bacterium]|nr:MAG: GDP-L-fucose synthase [bacterium]
MQKNSRIYIAGHTGLLGSALVKKLEAYGYTNIITKPRANLDLTVQSVVDAFFKETTPEYVFIAAGLTGGIIANKTYPATFLHTNISMQDNIFEAAMKHNTKHAVFYGSSCVYPRECPQPMKEDHLMTGPVEVTSEAYAAAKFAGLKACKAYNNQFGGLRFIALVPNSMYGPNDNFSIENSHVLSALMRRFHDAKVEAKPSITLWGTGSPRREFIFCSDVAEASIFAVKNAGSLENTFYNIGTGADCSIKELAEYMKEVTGFKGSLEWDTSKPDGAPKKLLDSKRFLSLGWKAETKLLDGLKTTYEWFLSSADKRL